MHEDQRSSKDTTPQAPDEPRPWVAPVLTDLGSFTDLTRLNPGGGLDNETAS